MNDQRVGICGDAMPVNGTPHSPALWCDLPAGHAGWHGADQIYEYPMPSSRISWSFDDKGYVAGVKTVPDALAAKRRILDLHHGAHECPGYDHNGDIDCCTWVEADDTCATVRHLAEAFGDVGHTTPGETGGET